MEIFMMNTIIQLKYLICFGLKSVFFKDLLISYFNYEGMELKQGC